jgi:hypothetical protein
MTYTNRDADVRGAQITAGIQRVATQREWRPPELRKLPIAATAHASKPGGTADDGNCMGKGEVSNVCS